jgi:hypothetical protein
MSIDLTPSEMSKNFKKDERKSRSLGSTTMLGCSVNGAENRRLCGAEHTLKYLPDDAVCVLKVCYVR